MFFPAVLPCRKGTFLATYKAMGAEAAAAALMPKPALVVSVKKEGREGGRVDNTGGKERIDWGRSVPPIR